MSHGDGVELVVGKKVILDTVNHHGFSGKIETVEVQGWGLSRYVVKDLGPLAGTLIGGATEMKEKFVTLEPILVRYNSRVPLFWYYGLRGLLLIYLPYAFGFDFFGLPLFALFYGLDWIATVPPTVRLTTDVFGKTMAPIVFGWIVAGHQLGAATAALVAGSLRATLGNYTMASMLSGGVCIVGAFMVLRIARRAPVNPAPVGA